MYLPLLVCVLRILMLLIPVAGVSELSFSQNVQIFRSLLFVLFSGIPLIFREITICLARAPSNPFKLPVGNEPIGFSITPRYILSGTTWSSDHPALGAWSCLAAVQHHSAFPRQKKTWRYTPPDSCSHPRRARRARRAPMPKHNLVEIVYLFLHGFRMWQYPGCRSFKMVT